MTLHFSKIHWNFFSLLFNRNLCQLNRIIRPSSIRMSSVVPSSNELENSNVLTTSDMVVDKNAYTVVKEGRAEVLFPSARDVFYNPVQEFNRDLSILALQVISSLENVGDKFPDVANATVQDSAKSDSNRPDPSSVAADSVVPDETDCDASATKDGADGRKANSANGEKRGLRVLEALAASGLRSCRFALEVTDESSLSPSLSTSSSCLLTPRGLETILACDLSTAAVSAIERNTRHNGVQHIVKTHRGDANMLMYSLQSDRYDVIDLDPYGSPVPFLDAAVRSVTEGGILQVTCTDMAVLCGCAPEKCQALYGAMPARGDSCHEMALRIALQCINSYANRYGRYIEPLLSVSVDFYIRLYVRVRTSQSLVKLSAAKSSYLLLCVGCRSWQLQPRCLVVWNNGRPKFKLPPALPSGGQCAHCRSVVQLCGPIWSEPLHDPSFVQCLLHRLPHTQLGTAKRIEGVLTLISEELADIPLHYDVTKLTSACRVMTAPTKLLRSALLNAGYRVSGVHTSAKGLKTDAPASFMWQMIRAWEKRYPASKTTLEKDEVAAALLLSGNDEDVSVDFTEHPEAKAKSQLQNLLRFQQNPTPNWGPKARAKSSIFNENLDSKRIRNQGKKSRNKSDVKDDVTASESFSEESASDQSENGDDKRRRVD